MSTKRRKNKLVFCVPRIKFHTLKNHIDRCLAKTKFKPEHLQLLGVASFLIATKLDEYHPANINDLCRLTENSVTQDKVV